MSETLKPCPFCGGEPFTLAEQDHYRTVGCNECDYGMASQGGDPPDIIHLWNRRADDKLRETVREVAEELNKRACTGELIGPGWVAFQAARLQVALEGGDVK